MRRPIGELSQRQQREDDSTVKIQKVTSGSLETGVFSAARGNRRAKAFLTQSCSCSHV